MRLERLTLAPYGGFADRTLEFRPDAPLHVVIGRNEAGKTTALSAIADLLYGFPQRTEQAWRFDMRALRVSGLFRLGDGAGLEARRRKGAVNTLVDADDKPIPEGPFAAALGGVDRATFETEFGLTARALREGGETLLRAGGALAETLAAGSANVSALVRLRDRLGEEANALFAPRKSAGKAFYVALNAYEAADKKLRETIVTSESWKAAEQKRAAALNEEHRLREDYEEAGRALAKCERAGRTHATLARLAALAKEVEAFADLAAIDAGALSAAHDALNQDRALQAELARLAAETEAEAMEIAKLTLEPALIEAGAAIDALRERLGAVRKAAEDLPRRVEARAQALQQLDDLARRLGLADHEAVLAAPPSDAELALARHALDARRDATRRAEEARGRAREALRRRDDLAREAEAEPALDPEPLRRRLDALAERVADVERLRRERAAIAALARSLAEEAERLDPPVADLDTLARASLPGAADLAAFARADQDRAEARQVARRSKEAAARDAATAETALRAREREAAGATRADWLAAREARERGLDRLGAGLDGDPGARRESFEGARSLALAADAIGEKVLADTERAARLEAAREALVMRRDALQQAEREEIRLAHEGQAAERDWLSLWARSGVAPLVPAAMARWLDRLDALLQRRSELQQRRAEAEALAARIAEAEASLAAAFASLGLTPPPGFEPAYREARSELAARQSAFEAARKAAEARAQAGRLAREAEAEGERRERELADLGREWPRAMGALRLGETASGPEAEAALAAWGAVALPRQNASRETRSIEGIEGDLADFERNVRAIVAGVAPELADASPEAALARIAARLSEARRAAAERAQLEKSAAARATRQRAAEGRRQALAPALAAASARFAAADEGALALALERSEGRRSAEAERVDLLRRLAEAGDGLSEAELRGEQQGLDPAGIAEEVARARDHRAALDAQRREAARAARDAEAEFETLSRGRDAASAARERMEARGDLLDIAERWLIRQGAARLAARAIERHRAALQDPLTERAGALFRLATGESFSGLAMDFDDSDRPVLKAQRANGERVKVEALSEGARDQLFLSLRLALLERRAGEPLPFIGDDILASFDDERTELTLRLLAEFGRGRQALLFTHHNHVAELARAAGADVIEL